MAFTGDSLPTASVLEQWRDDMATGRGPYDKPYAIKTVNSKLAAARKMLRAVAQDVTDLTVKMSLRDWANVSDAKDTVHQDKTGDDYGLRLTLPELERLVNAPDISHVKGLRDRALIALMAGAGLRVAEVVALTLRDVFLTENDQGQRGIKVRRGKHNKSRTVVINSWNSWVIQAVEAYAGALGLSPLEHPDKPIFEGVKRAKGKTYTSNGKTLSKRGAQRAVEAYTVDHQGKPKTVAAHDLRRTYAKLCKQAGMSWDALRENMGHSSVKITENYVGFDVDWSERIPNWSIDIDK